MLTFYYLIFLVVLLLGYAIGIDLRRIRKKRERINSRPIMTDDELYNQYYLQNNMLKEDVLFYWKEISHFLKLDYRKLRPTDSFLKELTPVKGQELSDEIEDVLEFLQNEALENKITFIPSKIKNLNDVIILFARRKN